MRFLNYKIINISCTFGNFQTILTLSLWAYECRTRPAIEETQTHHSNASEEDYDLEDQEVFVNAEDNLPPLELPNEEDAV